MPGARLGARPGARDGAANKADVIPTLLELTVQRTLEKFPCCLKIDFGDGCTTLCKYIKNH